MLHIHSCCWPVLRRRCKLFGLFQNNAHKLTLVMTPEEDYNKKCRDAELLKLMEKVSALSPDEKENIYKTGKVHCFDSSVIASGMRP